MRVNEFANLKSQARLSLLPGLVLLVLLWSALDLAAQPSNTTLRLSLRQCVGLALNHNLSIQIGQLSPEQARYVLQASRGIYDPVLSLSAAATSIDQPAQFDPKKTGTDAEYELIQDPVGASLNGRLPYGLTYGLSSIATYAHVLTYFPSNIFNLNGPSFAGFVNGFAPDGSIFIRGTNAWFQTTGLTLSQPLLKDFWIDIYRTTVQVNKKNLEISELVFKQAFMTNIVTVETNYFELLRAREQIKVQQKSLELNNQLLSEVRKQVKTGTLAPLEITSAESAVESTRSLLAGAEGYYAIEKNILKNLISDRLHDWMSTDIEPSENLIAVNVPTDSRESWMNALSRRPDLLAARLGVDLADINLRYLQNQLYPGLVASGSYGFQEEMPSFSQAFNQLRNGANAYYSASLLFSLPLANIAARNTYQGGKVAKHQASLILTKMQQDIVTEVDNAVKTVQYTYQQVGATRKAREFAEEALNAQMKLLVVGQVTPFIVLEFQRNLTTARSAELLALADFNKAKAHLAFTEGATLDAQGIVLKVH